MATGDRVHIGSDHAGYEVKNQVIDALRSTGVEVVDHGPFGFDPDDDYPVFCLRTAEAVAADDGSLGLVLGGSGNGEQMAANKVNGIRAALAWSPQTARLAREHNDARVLSVGARMHPLEDVIGFVEAFLAAGFSGDERHVRRLRMLSRYEESGELPPIPGTTTA